MNEVAFILWRGTLIGHCLRLYYLIQTEACGRQEGSKYGLKYLVTRDATAPLRTTCRMM